MKRSMKENCVVSKEFGCYILDPQSVPKTSNTETSYGCDEDGEMKKMGMMEGCSIIFRGRFRSELIFSFMSFQYLVEI